MNDKQPDVSEEQVFAEYAGFYDALYADKDYEAECDFLVDVFARHGVDADGSVLDLGCGTGGHVIPLARRGYAVTGVDRSAEMLRQACDKTGQAGVSAELIEGDVCSVRVGRSFDAVISMFAVVCYQLSNDDLAAFFTTARKHLQPGGVLVFDAWFGPAVLTTQPEERSKSVFTPEGDEVVRTARPTLDVVAQTVRVDYDVVRTHGGAEVEHTRESHAMRFLFAQEIAFFLEAAGFDLERVAPFLELDREPTAADWNISVVAVAR